MFCGRELHHHSLYTDIQKKSINKKDIIQFSVVESYTITQLYTDIQKKSILKKDIIQFSVVKSYTITHGILTSKRN